MTGFDEEEGYPEEHTEEERERVKRLMKEIKGVGVIEF